MNKKMHYSLLEVVRPRQKLQNWYKLFNRIESMQRLDDLSKTCSVESLSEQRVMHLQDFNSIDMDYSELGIKRCLSETFHLLKEYTQSNDGTLYIVNGNEIQKIIPCDEGFTYGMKWKIEEGTILAAYVAFTGKYMCLNKVCDIHDDCRFPLGTSAYDRRPLSVMCIPAETPYDTTLAVFEYVKFEKCDYCPTILKFALGMISWMTKAVTKKFQRIRFEEWNVQFNEKLLNIFYLYSIEEIDCDKLISDIMIWTRDFLKAKQIWYYIPVNKRKKEVYMYEEGLTNPDILFRKHKSVCIDEDRIVSYVWDMNTVLNIAGAEQLQEFDVTNPDILSILCVPIGSEEKVLGIAKVINKHNDEQYTTEDAAEIRRSCVYCALAVNHCNLKEEYGVVEQMFEEQKQTVLNFSLGCEHDIATFLSAVRNVSLPKGIEEYDWYPNERQREYLAEYIWMMFRNLFKDEPFFEKFGPFLMAVRQGYRHVPYHNFEHAFNVAHCIYVVVATNEDEFSQFEKICLLIAGLGHDLDHPGFTNQFLKFSNHPMAQLYPSSYLEHHHSFLTRLLIDHYKLFSHLSAEEVKLYHREIHYLIIDTDLNEFVKKSGELAKVLSNETYDDTLHRHLMKSMLMSTADLSGCAKPDCTSQRIMYNWYQELFNEGDEYKLRGIKPASFMDRDNYKAMPKQQVAFMQVMCEISADLLSQILPNTRKLYDLYKSNRRDWEITLPHVPLVEAHLQKQLEEFYKKKTTCKRPKC